MARTRSEEVCRGAEAGRRKNAETLMPRVRCPGGSTAAQCGEALPHRRAQLIEKEAAPPDVEAQPRRWKSKWTLSVSHRLNALCGGRAAKARRNGRKLTTCA